MILLIFEALLIFVLCHFVVLRQKGESKILNTEKTEKKKQSKKNFNLKHDIGFLNFLRNMTFTILASFQNFVVIILSIVRL